MQMQWYSPPQRVGRRRPKSLKVPALAFLGVGVILLLIAIYFLNETLSFLKHATATATATIITCPIDTFNDSRGSCPPTFQFRTADEKTITKTDSVEGDYQVNQQVPVAYDPSDPQGARISSFMLFWFLPTLLGGLGALFFLMGVGFGVGHVFRR